MVAAVFALQNKIDKKNRLVTPQSISKRPSNIFPAPLYTRSMAVRLSSQQQKSLLPLPFGELYLQKLEREYIVSKPEAPKLWLRKVDDTFVVTKQDPQIML